MNENKQITDDFMPDTSVGIPQSLNLDVITYLTKNNPFLRNKATMEIEDGEMPHYIQENFWSFISKDSVLTNNDKDDIRSNHNRLESAIEAYMMKCGPGEFTWETLEDLENLRSMVNIKDKRAKDGFERKQQVSQITQSLYGEASSGANRPKRKGLFGSLFGGP